VGWLWYLGTLTPVIGLAQAGEQAMADRFTYGPLVGLFIIFSWGIPFIVQRWHYRKIILSLSAGLVLSVFAALTFLQVRHWESNVTLFKHAINVTPNSYVAHYNLAISLAGQKRLQEAIPHYYEALRIKPDLHEAHNSLGVAFWLQGNVTEAIDHYTQALRIKPDYPEALNNLALALFSQGNLEKALAHYYEALRIKPDYAVARDNLQQALKRTSNPRERRTL
jgi:tetratricopeptide (TPR) repeat protein